MKDTVSGVLGGVDPKGTAPGTVAALIPWVTRTSVSDPVTDAALAGVAVTESTPTASQAVATLVNERKTPKNTARVDFMCSNLPVDCLFLSRQKATDCVNQSSMPVSPLKNKRRRLMIVRKRDMG
jgi:hypothetical protein